LLFLIRVKYLNPQFNPKSDPTPELHFNRTFSERASTFFIVKVKMSEKSSKNIIKAKTNEFLSNKHNADALRAILDSLKVSRKREKLKKYRFSNSSRFFLLSGFSEETFTTNFTFAEH
jgi:hypothetical protein